MKKHANIPVFIPHIGCPNDCVFCNQRRISGHTTFDKSNVKKELDAAFSTISPEKEVQIAYFGGSFTGIDREEMISLLALANEYIDGGKCTSIRISTRPDYLSPEILAILKDYRVRTVELGVQSMDDRVLALSRRGHTARDTEKAFSLLLAEGFELVGQMMTGLPGADLESEKMTAERIAEMGAHGARIYPTVVFEDTALYDMAKSGAYTPFTTEEAVSRTAEVLGVFIARHVPVIRIGLQASEVLVSGQGVSGGGYHPAIGEMVYARHHRNAVDAALANEKTEGKALSLAVNPRDVSAFSGQRAENKKHWIESFGLSAVKIRPAESAVPYTFTYELTEK